jgi:predicted membrane-bound spermidine synthase
LNEGLSLLLQIAGEAVIATTVIVGNLLVLLAIAIVPSLQTVTNYFVASVAAADLLVGILGKLPVNIIFFVRN